MNGLLVYSSKEIELLKREKQNSEGEINPNSMEMAAIHFSTFAPHKPTVFCSSPHISPSKSPKLSFRAASNVQPFCQRPKRARKHFTAYALSDDTDTAVGSAVKVADSPSLALKKKAMDVAPALKGTCIFLIGMKSSIKTQLAKALAEVLGYYYFDSDALIEEAAGGEASAKLFKETDEQGFRNSETEVLKQLSSMGRLVVCAGDGAVQSSTNLALLRYGISIWVDVPLDIIADGEHSEDLAVQFEELSGGYATADVTVSLQKMAAFRGYDDFTAVTAEEMALEVLKELAKLTRVKKMMEEAGRPF